MNPQRVRSGLLAGLGMAYLTFAYELETPRILGVRQLGRVTCPLLALTGIPCPLCGTTRSWNAAFRMDWADAFGFHPIAPLFLPLAIAATVRFALHFAGISLGEGGLRKQGPFSTLRAQ